MNTIEGGNRIRKLGVLSIALLIFITNCTQLKTTSEMSKKLHALFEEDWEWRLKDSPELATYIGDIRYNDRLRDLSFEAVERRKAHEREMLMRIKQIKRSRLSGQDAISYDLFFRNRQIAVEGQQYPNEWMPISQLEGPQIDFQVLAGLMPFNHVKDYENYIARLEAFPKYVDQVIDLMRRGIEMKWAQPAVPLRSVPAQIESQITDDAFQNPLYRVFDKFSPEISESERSRLKTTAQKSITESIVPAFKRLDAFVKEIYLPACRREIAASALPNGKAYYEYSVRFATTTSLSPQEIHRIGLEEVKRIHQEMETIIHQVKFIGSFQDFVVFLHSDPRFYYTKPEDLLMNYRDIAKRADAELPRLFAELPRTPYGIIEIPAHLHVRDMRI